MAGEEYFIDFIPNHIKQGVTRHAKDSLRKRFENSIEKRIVRWGELSAEIVRVKPFELLFRQARHLYIDGYLEAVIALCGMTVEALCISLAEDRVTNTQLKKPLINPRKPVRSKVKTLTKYYKSKYSESLLNDVLDIRRKYLHIYQLGVSPKEALNCVNKLQLVLLGEYGIIPIEQGRFREIERVDVENRAQSMGLKL